MKSALLTTKDIEQFIISQANLIPRLYTLHDLCYELWLDLKVLQDILPEVKSNKYYDIEDVKKVLDEKNIPYGPRKGRRRF